MKKFVLIFGIVVVMPLHVTAMESSSDEKQKSLARVNRPTERELFGSSFGSAIAGEGYGLDSDDRVPTPSYVSGDCKRAKTPGVDDVDSQHSRDVTPQFSPSNSSDTSYSSARHVVLSPSQGGDADSVSAIDTWDELRDDLAYSISKQKSKGVVHGLEKIFAAAKKNDLGHTVRCVIGGYLTANEGVEISDFRGSRHIYAINAEVLADALYSLWICNNSIPENFSREFVIQSSVIMSNPRYDSAVVIEMFELLSQVAHFIFRDKGVVLAEFLDTAAAACDLHDDCTMMLSACYADFLKRGFQGNYLSSAKSRAVYAYLRIFKQQFSFYAPTAPNEYRAFFKPLCGALKRWAREMDKGVVADILIVVGKEMKCIANEYTDFIELLEHIAIQAPRVLESSSLTDVLCGYWDDLPLQQDSDRLDALLNLE